MTEDVRLRRRFAGWRQRLIPLVLLCTAAGGLAAGVQELTGSFTASWITGAVAAFSIWIWVVVLGTWRWEQGIYSWFGIGSTDSRENIYVMIVLLSSGLLWPLSCFAVFWLIWSDLAILNAAALAAVLIGCAIPFKLANVWFTRDWHIIQHSIDFRCPKCGCMMVSGGPRHGGSVQQVSGGYGTRTEIYYDSSVCPSCKYET